MLCAEPKQPRATPAVRAAASRLSRALSPPPPSLTNLAATAAALRHRHRPAVATHHGPHLYRITVTAVLPVVGP
eukprot:3548621-Prymnesium_polylepis.1